MNPEAIAEFVAIVGRENVLTSHAELLTYRNDAYPLEAALPGCVVLPADARQTAGVVRVCSRRRIPFAPRGAGTGKSGGALLAGGVLVCLSRMTRILRIDLRNRRLTAQAGAVNVTLTRAVQADGLLFAPDPSSQGASTLGGNIGNNAGGPHTLKYGVTSNHLAEAEVVLPDGRLVTLAAGDDAPGYDLLGLVCGSEGTMGIVAAATVRLSPAPQSIRTLLAIFDTIDDATATVTSIIASGIMPAALEMMDGAIIRAVEEAYHYGIPCDAGAALIVELDGVEAGIDRAAKTVSDLCSGCSAREVRTASDAADRARLWLVRRRAPGSVGRLAPSCVTQDCVIPRTKLPQAMRAIAQIGARFELRIANVFHAGDGNLHPIVLFDVRDADQVARVAAANRRIIETCLALGGSLSGEHGVGMEKRDYMPLQFSAETLDAMARIRDVFNPGGLCNPGKVLPSSHGCTMEMPVTRGALAV